MQKFIVGIGITVLSGSLWAQPLTLQETIAVKSAQSSEQVRKLGEQEQAARDEALAASKRADEIKRQKLEAEKASEVEILHGEFKDLLFTKFSHGPCEFSETENVNEFLITRNNSKILLRLAPEKSGKKAIGREVIDPSTGLTYTEYRQPGWSDEAPTKTTFEAVIRTVKKADGVEELIYSQFNGKRIDDRGQIAKFIGGFIGQGSLPPEDNFLCVNKAIGNL